MEKTIKYLLAITLIWAATVFPANAAPLYDTIIGRNSIPMQYENVTYFQEGLAGVQVREKWGFIDKNGRMVIEAKYDLVRNFQNGLAIVVENEKWGVIDKSGKVVVPFIYDYINDYSEGLAAATKNEEGYVIDTLGNVVFKTNLTLIGSFSQGAILCQDENDLCGVLDKTGKEILAPIYESYAFMGFQEGLAPVRIDDKWGYIDTKGNLVIPSIFDGVAGFNEGLSIVQMNGLCSVIDRTGKLVFQTKYPRSYSEGFREGFMIVGTEDIKFGYMDKNGNLITPVKYDWPISFKEGLAGTVLGDRIGFIDRTGKEVIPIKYETGSYGEFNEGLTSVKLNEKMGYIDQTGEVVIPFDYDEATLFSEGFAPVKKGDLWGFVSVERVQKNQEIKAKSTASHVYVNEEQISLEAYNIDGNNYFKLRDLAMVLNETEKQFGVGWDNGKKVILLTSHEPYVSVGGEMVQGDGTAKVAKKNTSTIYLDGNVLELQAYTINNNNYFKLRDIGKAFDIGILYDYSTNTIKIDTKRGYID